MPRIREGVGDLHDAPPQIRVLPLDPGFPVCLPVRREEYGTTGTENRTYPGYPTGYRPADLGAHPIMPRERLGGCPVAHTPSH